MKLYIYVIFAALFLLPSVISSINLGGNIFIGIISSIGSLANILIMLIIFVIITKVLFIRKFPPNIQYFITNKRFFIIHDKVMEQGKLSSISKLDFNTRKNNIGDVIITANQYKEVMGKQVVSGRDQWVFFDVENPAVVYTILKNAIENAPSEKY